MGTSDSPKVRLQASAPSHPSDECVITSAAIDGDELRLGLTYTGGCREHVFDVVAVPGEGSGDVRLHLRHDANGDDCKALVRTTRAFSLTSLVGLPQADAQIWLTLPDVGRLRYPTAAPAAPESRGSPQ